MNRDLIYRLLGYAVAAVLLRYAALQTEIWLFWSQSGYLGQYYPAWWIALAAAMVLMSIVLFMPAFVPKRHRGTPFLVLRLAVALYLLAFYWHWCGRDGWIFHDWVAHPYLGQCSDAHGGDLFMVLLVTVGHATVPLLGWQLNRWKEWRRTCLPCERRRTIIRRTKAAASVAGLVAAVLIVATMILVRDPQGDQRQTIQSTLRARGALLSYTAPRRVRAIPLVGGMISDLLYKYGVVEFSGILAIGDPVEDDDLRVLSGYSNLRDITLEGSKVTDKGVRYLTDVPNLEWVNVSKCPITDACLQDLMRIERLSTLFIEETQISRTGASLLKAAFPDGTVFVTKEPNHGLLRTGDPRTARQSAEP